MKVFFYFQLWWPFFSAERNHFNNFGRRSLKEHFYEIILKLGHWPRTCRLKVFFILSFGGHFVKRSLTVLTILAESHSRNISVKLF